MNKILSTAMLCLSVATAFAISPAAMTGASEIFVDNAAKQVLLTLPPTTPAYEGFDKLYMLDGKGTLLSETEFRTSEAYTPGTTHYDYKQGLRMFRAFDWNDFDSENNVWKQDLHYSSDWAPEPEKFSIDLTNNSRILLLPDYAYETVYDEQGRPMQVYLCNQVKPRLADKHIIRSYKYASDNDRVLSSMSYTDVEGSDDNAPEVNITENYSNYQFNDRGSWVQRTVQVTRYYPDTRKTVTEKPYAETRQILYQ